MPVNKRIVEYRLGSGREDAGVVLVEIDVDPRDGLAPVSNNIIHHSPDTFQAALDKVKPALQEVAKSLRDINQPDEITLEFGLKLTANAGVVIASAETEVTFNISLSWRK